MPSTAKLLREFIASRAESYWIMSPPTDETLYSSAYDYLLDHGREYDSSPLTAEELSVLMKAVRATGGARSTGGTEFRQGECYRNAAVLALSDSSEELTYCEGVAKGGVMPVLHAWVVLRLEEEAPGKVVDLTWRVWEGGGEVLTLPEDHPFRDRFVGNFPSTRAYFGEEFQDILLLCQLDETQQHSPMIEGQFGLIRVETRSSPIPSKWRSAREQWGALQPGSN